MVELDLLEQVHVLGQAVREWRAAQQPDDRVSAPMQRVLEHLFAGGPMTVPTVARLERVSRQHVQLQVDRLVELDLVELRPNPAHRRSVLAGLSDAGRAWVQDMRARQRNALARLQVGVSDAAMQDATRVLSAWRHALLAVHLDR